MSVPAEAWSCLLGFSTRDTSENLGSLMSLDPTRQCIALKLKMNVWAPKLNPQADGAILVWSVVLRGRGADRCGYVAPLFGIPKIGAGANILSILGSGPLGYLRYLLLMFLRTFDTGCGRVCYDRGLHHGLKWPEMV